ncbi:MAG: ribonucleoside triphosphate reductase [Bulleidia sp.]
MYRVRKRDGKTADFDIQKIVGALRKAFDGSHRQYNDDIINMLALRVTGNFESRIIDGCVDVEDIQDSAEKVLSECGYSDVAKAYILYRKQRENIRNIEKSNVDYRQIVDTYLNSKSWKGNEGKCSGYSVGGLIMSNSGAVTGNYWLSEVYDREIAQAHRNGDLYIHDLNMLTGHCTGWSLPQIMEQGLIGVAGNVSCGPAKHLNTLCEQLVRFLGIVQNEWAGSQTFVSFDTYLAPFVRIDQLTYAQVKQCIQTFVYGVNTLSRWGCEPPYTNITLDLTVPKDLADQPALTGGKQQEFTYGECQEQMDILNRALFEVMREGDYSGNAFPYPIITCAVDEAFFETDRTEIFAAAVSGQAIVFDNFMMKTRHKSDVRMMKNGKKNDYRRLYRRVGGIYGNGENTGTFGLVSVNVPRIAFCTKGKEEFYRQLDWVMDLSARCLHTKKTVLAKLLDSGLYPYTKQYLTTLDDHFGMIGIMGLQEAMSYVQYGDDFETELIAHIRERLKSYQKKYETLFGLEATGSVSARTYLAEKDREKYPDMELQENDGAVIYSGSAVAGEDDDLFEILDQQEKILCQFTTGGVFHLLGTSIQKADEAQLLVRRIMENYHVPLLEIFGNMNH